MDLKKYFGIILIALVMTFGLSMVATAENTSVFFDYNRLTEDVMGDRLQEINYLTIGGEYSDNVILGASVSRGIGFYIANPGRKSSITYLYAGYNLINNEEETLGAIIGYYNYTFTIAEGTFTTHNLCGLGLKGALKAGPFTFGMTYLYGLHNELTFFGLLMDHTTGADISEDLFQFNIGYMFNDYIGLNLSYDRSTAKAVVSGQPTAHDDLSGCSLGVLYKF